MPPNLVILPILAPLVASVFALLAHDRRDLQKMVVGGSMAVALAAGVWTLTTIYNGPDAPADVLVTQLGNWPAPFGINAAADVLAAAFVITATLVSLCVYAFVLTQTHPRFTGGYFHTLFALLVAGVNWSFLTGDLFNLFVAFEVMLLASYGLLCSGTTPRQMRQAYKYVLINLVVSAIFVAGCGWVYGTLGTLNFAEMAVLARQGHVTTAGAFAVCTVVFVFATKAAAFPLWFWLPDTYPTLTPALGGLYAGLLTKVGVYCLLRVAVMCFGPAAAVADALVAPLMISAAVTMFVGVLGAVSSGGIRDILAVHVISQVGYMLMGVALALGLGLREGAATLAVGATLLFVVHNMIVKCALFLCCGLMEKYAGTDVLANLGGLLRRDAWLGALFLVAALSLVGLPPLSGFFGKLLLVQSTFARGDGWGVFLGITAVFTSTLTLLSMAKIWSYGFWSPPPAGTPSADLPLTYSPPRRGAGLVPVGILVAASLSIGLFAGPLYHVAMAGGRTVAEPDAYVAAVLGTQAVDAMYTPAATGGRP